MAPVTRITCRATVLARPPSFVAVWRLSLVLHVGATVLARTPSIVAVWRLSPVLHVELLC